MVNINEELQLTGHDQNTYTDFEKNSSSEDLIISGLWSKFEEGNEELDKLVPKKNELQQKASSADTQVRIIAENIRKFLGGEKGKFLKYVVAPIVVATVPYYTLKAKFKQWQFEKEQAKVDRIVSEEKKILQSFKDYRDAQEFVGEFKASDPGELGEKLAEFVGKGDNAKERFLNFLNLGIQKRVFPPQSVADFLLNYTEKSTEEREASFDNLGKFLQARFNYAATQSQDDYDSTSEEV